MRTLYKTTLFFLLANLCFAGYASPTPNAAQTKESSTYCLQHPEYGWYVQLMSDKSFILFRQGETHLKIHYRQSNLTAFTDRPEYLSSNITIDALLKNWKALLHGKSEVRAYIDGIDAPPMKNGTEAQKLTYNVLLKNPVKTDANTIDFTVVSSSPDTWPAGEIKGAKLTLVLLPA